MTDITLSQETDDVESLGKDKDLTPQSRARNTLTADIDGEDLSHAWVEISHNGSNFEPLEAFELAQAKQPTEENPDGIAIDNISLREGFDIWWASDDKERLLLLYTGPDDGAHTMYWAESPDGDPTHFENVQEVYSEQGKDDEKVESVNVFWDRDEEQLYYAFEDSGPGSEEHGYVAIMEADSREGKNWSNKQLIGGDHWEPDWHFASPKMYKLNDEYFITGEEQDTDDSDWLIAKGDSVGNYTEARIVAENTDYTETDGHFAMKDYWITPEGTFLSYPNLEYDGDFVTPVMHTETYDDNYPVENWTLEDRPEEYTVLCILDLFNDKYAYGYGDFPLEEIEYWHLDGDVIEKSVSSDGGTVEFEYYQPPVLPGSTIEWRVAVEDTGGNVVTSDPMSFDVMADPPTPPEEHDRYGMLRTGRVEIEENA